MNLQKLILKSTNLKKKKKKLWSLKRVVNMHQELRLQTMLRLKRKHKI